MARTFRREERAPTRVLALDSVIRRRPREEQSSFRHEFIGSLFSFPLEGRSAREASRDRSTGAIFTREEYFDPPIPRPPREEQSSFGLEFPRFSSSVSSFSEGRAVSYSPRLSTREVLPHYDEPRPEGYDEFFDPPLESKYTCPICLLGLREPMQTSCGHRFCKGCVLRSIRDAGPKCPVDNERLNESQIYADNFAKREMLSHDVFCRLREQHGCPWKGPLNNLEGHLNVCEFFEMDCPKECGRKFKRKDRGKHLEETCPNRPVPCRYCQREVKWNGLEEHFQVCLKYPQACEKCGQENTPRDMMEDHLAKKCPKTEITCPFERVGCSYKGLRPEVEKHVLEQLINHEHDFLTVFGDQTDNHQRGLTELRNTVTTLNNAAQHQDRRIQQQLQQLIMREFSEQMHQQRGELDEVMRRVTEESKENQTWKRKFTGAVTETFDRYSVEMPLEVLGRVCNGSYTWRIENFTQCRQDAVTGVATEMYSPAFYTSQDGYKLCVRINLNGVDSGAGKHIAVFVHMMQGDFDAILKWPFTATIILSILDQSDQNERDDITETLVPEPSMKTFQRPTTSPSPTASGFPHFVPIEKICEGKYVKNNTMFFRAEVLRQ